MILTDGTDIFSTDAEDIKEEAIINGNVEITLGGAPKNQADSIRLKIESRVRVPQGQMGTLKKILTNWEGSIMYTPSRTLLYKDSAAEMEVVVNGSPKIEQKFFDTVSQSVVFWVVLNLEEAYP